LTSIYIPKCSFLTLFTIPIIFLSFIILFIPLQQLAIAQASNSNETTKTTSKITHFLQYLNPDTGVQFDYPFDWKKVEDKNGVKFSSPFENTSDFFQEYVYIYSSPCISCKWRERVDGELEYIKQNYNIEPSTANPTVVNTTLAGNPAGLALFTYNDGKREMMMMLVFILKDDKEFGLKYFAEPSRFYEYLQIVQKLMDSFKIEFSQYENTILGISMQHPSDWMIEENDEIIKFYAPDYSVANTYLSVYVYDIPANTRPQDIRSSEESLQDFKLIGSSNTTMLGGGQAHMILYTFTSGRDEYEGKMIFTVYEGKVYQIKFFSMSNKFDNYLPIVQKMIESFKIIDFLPYENPHSRITIEYPSHWKKVINGRSVTFLSSIEGYSDSFQENVFVSSNNAPNMTLDKFIDITNKYYKQNYNIEPSTANLTVVNTTLSKQIMGYEIVYKYTDNIQREFTLYQIIVIHEGKVYQIKFFSMSNKFDNYLPIVQKMIESFKIIDFLPSESINFKMFKSSDIGIKIKYPYDWQIILEKSIIFFNTPLEKKCSTCTQTLSINILPSNNNMLHERVSSQINYFRQTYPHMKLIESNATTIGGNPAYKVVYTYGYSDSASTKSMELITIMKDKTYFIDFISDAERYYDYLPIIEKMLDSIIIDSSQSVNSIFQGINNEAGIRVANNPFAIAFNSNTKMLYVTNTRSNTVSVIDTLTNNIISNITVGNFPYAITIDSFQNTIYVANERSNTVSVIDGSTNRIVDTIGVDAGPIDIVVNSDTGRVYTANFCSNTISVIIASTNTLLKNITLGERPDNCNDFAMGIALNTFTNMIYVANRDSNTIYVIDGNTDNIVDRIFMYRPVSLAVNPLTNTIYSVSSDSNIVNVIDGYSNIVMDNEIPVDINPNIIIVNPSTNMLYVTNSGSNTLSVINGSTSKSLNVTVGINPAGVTIDPATNTIYVANVISNTVSVINGSTNNILVGVNFKVDPLNSGEIYCNESRIQNGEYKMYDIGTDLKCEVRANNIFPPMEFGSWSIIPPMIFESWTSDLASNSKNNPKATFKAIQHGHLVANFKELITTDYMNTIFGTVLSLAIPASAGLLYKKREWLFNKFGRQNN
jgi:YVTN family beta-propeller protein